MTPSTPALERMPWDDGVPSGVVLTLKSGWRVKSAPAELGIVDLITQHDEQADEELAGDRDLRFGAPPPVHEGEVRALEVGIHPRRMRGSLPEGEAEKGAALLGDVAEMMFIRRSIDSRGEANVADHVFAVREPRHGAQHDDGGQGRQGPDAGVSDEP